MSACRVCGKDVPPVDGGVRLLCDNHNTAWAHSPESARANLVPIGGRRMVAITDFITRARAEHQNGRGDASGPGRCPPCPTRDACHRADRCLVPPGGSP